MAQSPLTVIVAMVGVKSGDGNIFVGQSAPLASRQSGVSPFGPRSEIPKKTSEPSGFLETKAREEPIPKGMPLGNSAARELSQGM